MSDSILVVEKENLPREANKTNDSRFDRIYKYFHSKSRIELDAEELATMERWEKAWLLVCRKSRNEASKELVGLFNISRATAFDDIRNAMNLFTDPREDLKAAKRGIAEENFLKGADKAWEMGDMELHLKYMDKYAEINGLKEAGADGGIPDLLKKLKPVQVIMNFTAEDLMAEAERMRKTFSGIIDVTPLE